MFVTRAWPPPLACADRNELIAQNAYKTYSVNLATTSSYNAFTVSHRSSGVGVSFFTNLSASSGVKVGTGGRLTGSKVWVTVTHELMQCSN